MRNDKGQFVKNHQVPNEWREKVSIRHKGNTYRRGSIQTIEAKEKNRQAHLGGKAWNKGLIGYKAKESHWNWKGGIWPRDNKTNQYKEWREQVFERDNYTCQTCGKEASGHLNAHHIYYYSEIPEIRYSVKNGVTLCDKCHHKVHGMNRSIDKVFHEVFTRPENYQFIVGQNA